VFCENLGRGELEDLADALERALGLPDVIDGDGPG
jgi:hypothetical protein